MRFVLSDCAYIANHGLSSPPACENKATRRSAKALKLDRLKCNLAYPGVYNKEVVSVDTEISGEESKIVYSVDCCSD